MSSVAPSEGGREGGREAEGERPVESVPAGCALQDLGGAGAYVLNEVGRIVEVNRRAEILLARTADELIGRDAHDLLHRESTGQPLARTRCPIMQVFLGGHTEQGAPVWHLRGDDSVVPMSWLVTPCAVGPDNRGSVVLFHEFRPSEATEREPERQSDELSELDRLALLAETTTQLTATLEVEETLQRLTGLLVPQLADWVIVDLLNEADEVWRTAVVHHDGERPVRREDLEGPMPPVPAESPMPLSRALRGVASTVMSPETYQGPPDAGIAVAQRELFAATGMHSAAVAPIRGVREVLGALTLGRSERPTAFDDLSLLDDIARRAGLALDNVRLYQGQRQVAETMQRHLLPPLPSLPRVEMTVRYVPATNASQVGGDWYDSFTLPDGAAALAIGDVVGHDLDAAAAMAQVRNMLRAYAWSYREPPSVIVDRLDQAVENLAEASMATLIFGRLEGSDEGGWQLWWTNAGHPPPLLVTHDGQARYLGGEPDPLIGTGLRQARLNSLYKLPPRSTVLLYTDGLIESSERSIEDGLRKLRANAAALAHRHPDAFCDLLLRRVRPADNEDDVAMLALRTPDRGGH